MRIAMLSPIAWRTPPRHYGPWENVVSLLTEGLVERGVDVTLFATGDSLTAAKLQSVCARGYEEDEGLDPKVWEGMHIANLFERADEFDLIHNHFDYLPLTYSGMTTTPVLTTIHGFSSPRILAAYRRYNQKTFYAAISEADRSAELDYQATIHHGIDLGQFTFRGKADAGDYLVFFGRIHSDKGAREAIEVARRAGMRLIMAGIIQDPAYYRDFIAPHLAEGKVEYAGSVGPEERDRMLGGARALLHPIHFDEPFGLSVVEAMACGTPVIAFRRGSMRELIEEGVNGFLVEDVTEMVEAVARIGEIERARCRASVESRFTVERMVEDYLRLYRRICGHKTLESRRPWGYYKVLSDSAAYKTKEIVVFPGKRLSLQRHRHRAEHWLILEGEALVTLDGRQLRLRAGQSVDIPRGAKHRLANPGAANEVRFLEIQTGDYFGEDDIERFEDDYGRMSGNASEAES